MLVYWLVGLTVTYLRESVFPPVEFTGLTLMVMILPVLFSVSERRREVCALRSFPSCFSPFAKSSESNTSLQIMNTNDL